jgi:hypothetical protein
VPPTFLGVPLVVWGVVCLGVATLYYFVWPEPEAGNAPRPAWMRLVLRWFHSLVWLLLAAACFLQSAGAPAIGRSVGGVGLLVYVVFIVTAALDRSRRGGGRLKK